MMDFRNPNKIGSRAGRRSGFFAAMAFSLLVSVACAEETDGLFVAVGYGGRRISSRDGAIWDNDQRWSDVVADDDNVLFNIAYGLGRFIAVGGGAKIGHIVTTRDGKEWTELPQVKGRVATIVFANSGHAGAARFIAGHDSELLWSSDGEHFQQGQKLDFKGSVHARKSACGDTEAGYMTVIIGDVDLWSEKRRVSWRAATADGETWVSQTLETLEVRGIAYGAGHFVVVGPKGLIEQSHDGQNWMRCEIGTDGDFQSVIWSGSTFIAKGRETWTSPDGLAWTKEEKTLPCEPVFGREGLSGIGVSWGGNLFFSPDLRVWKKAAIPAGPSLNAAVWGPLR